MKRIGITGGIGSGKSYVCRLLAAQGIAIYDCDAAAKRLMRTSPELREQLIDLIGPEAYLAPSPSPLAPTLPLLNKAAIAQFLLKSEENAHAIDAIVHPAVARDFIANGYQWMECAILYESGFDRLVDVVIVVTAPEEVRLQRIIDRDGISKQKAQEWIARQWPQEEVRRRADYEIINDGIQLLQPQIDQLLNGPLSSCTSPTAKANERETEV